MPTLLGKGSVPLLVILRSCNSQYSTFLINTASVAFPPARISGKGKFSSP